MLTKKQDNPYDNLTELELNTLNSKEQNLLLSLPEKFSSLLRKTKKITK